MDAASELVFCRLTFSIENGAVRSSCGLFADQDRNSTAATPLRPARAAQVTGMRHGGDVLSPPGPEHCATPGFNNARPRRQLGHTGPREVCRLRARAHDDRGPPV